MRWGERRSNGRQQSRGEVDHGAGHPEARHQFLDRRLRVSEMTERCRPGAGCPWGGGLGEVTQDGDRAGRCPAAYRTELHRRQVLCLVHDYVAQAGVRLRRSATSSIKITSSTDHPAAETDRAGLAIETVACSSSLRMPSALAARNFESVSR